MINTTLDRLKCPRKRRGKSICPGSLRLLPNQKLQTGPSPDVYEVRSGSLECLQCKATFPILAGVAVLVDDVRLYLLGHVKGISNAVPDSEIPPEYLHEFLEAKAEIQSEHIEEDLEAERINALYLMNHYLRVRDTQPKAEWWKPVHGSGSPLIDSLIREHWDSGPFAQIEAWVARIARDSSPRDAIELGCGVGGLYPTLKKHLQTYLGLDSSFASIALARHITLGVPYRGSTRIPGDLLHGSVSRQLNLPQATSYDGHADFIVGDLEDPPLRAGNWNVALALNAIDMLDVPSRLPELKFNLLKKDGVAIQSCPYVWHEGVARKLRAQLPKNIQDSAKAVEWLYQRAGFQIEQTVDHLPWLFFKHLRQIEIYSVHLFTAKKAH